MAALDSSPRRTARPRRDPGTSADRDRLRTRDDSRVPQTIDDISSGRDLIRYAVAAQLAALNNTLTQVTVSRALDVDASKITKMLRGDQEFTDKHLRELDTLIVALHSPDRKHVGGLMSHAVRVRGRQENSPLAEVQADWTGQILNTAPQSEIDVFVQASAVMSIFMTTERIGRDTSQKVETYRKAIEGIVRQLILIGGSPPTSRNVDALTMLGGISSYAFDVTKEILQEALLKSPLGFRVWRAVTKLVRLSRPAIEQQLAPWVYELLERAPQLRAESLYPGRSLDLELATSIPLKWSEPPDDWVGRMLTGRARDTEATLRERGTAAHALWERALRRGTSSTGGNLEVKRDELRKLITIDREDISSGLHWLQLTLNHVIDEMVPTCNVWPDVDEEWFTTVNAAAQSLDRRGLPSHLLQGTKSLFRHALLQNAGVMRRHALDTLVAGGWVEPITGAMSMVLDATESPSWLRIRALFALGFLQSPNLSVRETLVRACDVAYDKVRAGPDPSAISEMHAALFAVGDCFGATGAEHEAAVIRQELEPLLRELATPPWTDDPGRRLIARATAYLLTVTAQPHQGADKDLSAELLWQMQTSQRLDRKADQLCRWTLGTAWNDRDGSVEPIFRRSFR